MYGGDSWSKTLLTWCCRKFRLENYLGTMNMGGHPAARRKESKSFHVSFN